jgi:glycosyltransferase involved in cell wall biosynthesis
MQRICTTLAVAGYDVTLIGRKLGTTDLVAAALPYAQHRLNCRFTKGKLFYIEYNIRLFFYLLTQQNDAFCAIDLDTILPNLLVAKLKNKPLIYDAHEYFSELPEVVNRPFTKKIWETIAAFAIPKCAACYTVGEGLAQIFAKRYQKPFGVVRNVPFLQPKPVLKTPNATKILLYQGALNDGRGLEEILCAMPLLQNANLWLVGEGDNSESLRVLATKLHLNDRVRFWGYVLPHDLKAITAQADIGINLLQNKGLNYYYSLANKFFDYIQAHIPSVNPAFPEYEAILAQHSVGICVSDLQPETLAAAIQPLIDDAAFYQNFQKNCRLAQNIYHWEAEKERLLAIYKGLV